MRSTYSSNHITEISNYDIDEDEKKPQPLFRNLLMKFKKLNRAVWLFVFVIVAVVLIWRRKLPKRVPIRLLQWVANRI